MVVMRRIWKECIQKEGYTDCFANMLINRNIPVSYTHLDVYKRQDVVSFIADDTGTVKWTCNVKAAISGIKRAPESQKE